MKGKSPIVTLLVGLIFAGVVVVANLNAAKAPAGNPYGAGDVVAVGGKPSAPSPTAPTAPASSAPASSAPASSAPASSAPAKAPITRATFAGYTTGSGISIAIAIHDGVAVAYLCSGKIESWLRGKAAADGTMTLTGTHKGTLTATYTAKSATGTVTAYGKSYKFTIKVVHAPSGLWRAAAEVRNAKVVAGWVVVDGYQVGMVDVGGQESKAPPLDLGTGTAPVDGTTLHAGPVDGDSGTGFDQFTP